MNPTEVLRRLVTALDKVGIAYMLSGSLAGAYYGISRSTQDIDFVIDATAEQLQAFVQHLRPDEYYVDLNTALEAHRQRSLFNLIDLSGGWKRQIADVAGILRVRLKPVDRAYLEKWVQDLQLQTQWKQALMAANLSG